MLYDENNQILLQKSKIKLIWYTFLEIAGIENLDAVPNTNNFDKPDVKAAMYMYSMESFLYKRINKVAIDRFTPSIKNLGPYSVLISRVIEKSHLRKKTIQGAFNVYRGLSLPSGMIREWENSEAISLDGYSSTSMNKGIAKYFALESDTSGGKQIVLLDILIQNESGKHYFSLDSQEFTLYPDE